MMKSYIVEKLDHYGRGIVRIGGKTIFVLNGLPQEKIDIRITVDKSKYNEGVVVQRYNDADMRVDSPCPYYDICGGCDIMHMNYEHQLLFKQNKVTEIMTKFVDLHCVKDIVPTTPYYYRNKVTLHVKEKIGYYARKSYDIIPIDHCMIADKRINALLPRLYELELSKIDSFVIRVTKRETMLVVYLKNSGKVDSLSKLDDLDSIITIYNDEIKVIHGKEVIEEVIHGIKFAISPTSFFQVNPEGMEKIYQQAIAYADLQKEDCLLDLYCGTGTIGIYASKYVNKVLGIEINQQAIKDANRNKEINHISNIQFQSGDVKEVLKRNNFKPNVVIVDPPRSGLDKGAMSEVLALKAPKLVYISCDPVTLARDLNGLKEVYDILEITPFDMFPNTYHVECVCFLRKH